MSTKNLIAITGGIGSGKSTVSRFWAKYSGFPLVDIDQLCRELLDIEKPGWIAIREQFGTTFFHPDGLLNREMLRKAIFDDEFFRERVDRIMHPLALDLLQTEIEGYSGVVLVDVPLLYEAGWGDTFQRCVVVYADQQTCCRRLSSRDNILPEDAVKAIFSQTEISVKAMKADHVIDNRYCWPLTRLQVARLDDVVRSFSSDEKPLKEAFT